jgi:serine/threonine-protein kinase
LRIGLAGDDGAPDGDGDGDGEVLGWPGVTVAHPEGGGVAASGQATLAETLGGIPRVLLRDTESGSSPSPVVRPSSPQMPRAGGRSGRLQLLGEVARGGMGAILKGRDVDLGRDLAVKVLLEQHKNRPELVGRFIEEAQIAGQLQHPGVVPVYELGTLDDCRPYFAMKLVKGRTLTTLLEERSSPEADRARLLGIFEQVCQTMAYAHARGVIHRDLKPSNVMVGSFGEVQVMDWGLAKVLSQGGISDDQTAGRLLSETVIHTGRAASDSDASLAGSVMGTPSYMAPEQACGDVERLDERTDVFALGSILCELLTGRPAFTGRTSGEIQRKAARGDLTDAFGRLDGCGADAELIALAKDCLAAEPEDRPHDAGAVTGRLAAYMTGVQERLRASELARVEAQARAEEETKQRVLTDALAREAQAHAAEERRRRRLQVGLAAAVLALTTVGGLSTTAYLHQRQARAAQVDLTLNEATLLRDQARAAADDLARWQAAREASRRVEVALGEDGDPRARRRLAALRREIDDGMAAAHRDRELLDALADIRSTQVDLGPREADASYAEAFRRAGIDIDILPQAEAADHIRARPRAVALQLAGYLDSWHAIRRKDDQPPDRWRRPLAVAQLVDPDPYRDRLRALAERDDLREQRGALHTLAEDPQSTELPPVSLLLLAAALRQAGDQPGALAVLEKGVERHPGDVWLNYSLAGSLPATRREEALRYYTAARALRPETAHEMAHLLVQMGRVAEGITAFRELVRVRPTKVKNMVCLASTLRKQGQDKECHAITDRAIATARAALRRRPDDPQNQHDLGLALGFRGNRDEAIAAFRAAVRSSPRNVDYQGHLASLLEAKGDHEGAIAAYREIVHLRPNSLSAHHALSHALLDSGDRTGAIAESREAVRLQPDSAHAHYTLGWTLSHANDQAGAVQAYREAIRLEPDYAEAHCNIGIALRKQGRYAEAVEELRQGHKLGAKRPDWTYPSAQWLRQAELAVRLEAKLPAILQGEGGPAGTSERLALASMCYDKGWHAAASGFWSEVFAAEPRVADDLKSGQRYNAACSAAIAGGGRSKDDPPPDDVTRAGLRRQARQWLKADLALRAQQLQRGTGRDHDEVQNRLTHWKHDRDLAALRDEAELAKLPEAERTDCRALWAEVEALLARAQEQKP